jgi:hypothetical protein
MFFLGYSMSIMLRSGIYSLSSWESYGAMRGEIGGIVVILWYMFYSDGNIYNYDDLG